MKQEKSLYENILQEIMRMDSVIIRSSKNGQTLLENINEIGEIIIGYKTQKISYLGGLIRINRPLNSLGDIQRTLTNNLRLEPLLFDESHVTYSRTSYKDYLVPGNLWSNPRLRLIDIVRIIEEGTYMDGNRNFNF